LSVCVPIPAKDFQTLLNMICMAEESGADLIEVRLDYMGEKLLENLGRLKDIVSVCSTPLIATNRHRRQGGECVLSEEDRIRSLLIAADAGFNYIDVEMDTLGLHDVVDRVKAYGAKVIISHHIFTHTPPVEELDLFVKKQIEANANVCKVVTMANSVLDSVRCLVFTYEASRRTNLVCFAMGEKGILSRILSPVFGASFTYASLKKGLETAPGQITIHELKEIYKRMGIE